MSSRVVNDSHRIRFRMRTPSRRHTLLIYASRLLSCGRIPTAHGLLCQACHASQASTTTQTDIDPHRGYIQQIFVASPKIIN